MEPIKPGIKTSEFWLTTATTIISLLVMAGAIGPEDQSRLVELAKAAITGIIALTGLVAYVAGRVKLKSQ